MTERAVGPKTLSDSLSRLEDLLRPELFRALADPTRLAILQRLITAPEPWTVGQVAELCGVHLSGVSRHLAVLRDAGVVEAERRGREVLYRPETESLTRALRELAAAVEACRLACCGPSCCDPDPTETDEHAD